jgi:hypothetical protein
MHGSTGGRWKRSDPTVMDRRPGAYGPTGLENPRHRQIIATAPALDPTVTGFGSPGSGPRSGNGGAPNSKRWQGPAEVYATSTGGPAVAATMPLATGIERG